MGNGDDDDDDDDECSLEDKSRVAGHLCQFIENCLGLVIVNDSESKESCIYISFELHLPFHSIHPELKALIKFWVFWQVPTTSLKLEVTKCNLPKSSTFFETLWLPSLSFEKELLVCINTVDTGLGLLQLKLVHSYISCFLNSIANFKLMDIEVDLWI